MAPKVKAALGVVSGALETMCGWAFCVVALYALLFMNLTGNGCLWDSLRGVVQDAAPERARDGVRVEMRVVPVRPPDMARAQNRMLAIPDSDTALNVRVEAPDQGRQPGQITDAPADATAKKDWRPHLNGRLRTFTVYGQGEQSSSAAIPARGSAGGAVVRSVAATAASASIASAPTPAAAGSAYRIGAMTGEARPGISDHVSSEDSGGADGLRNFR